NGYLNAHPEIQHVYVTGHSLGASMAQRFMTDPHIDVHTGAKLDAVTFASPGYGASLSTNNAHILNVLIYGDPVVALSPYVILGDKYQIVDYNSTSGGPAAANLHDMQL